MKIAIPNECHGIALEVCAQIAAIVSAEADRKAVEIAENANYVNSFVALIAFIAAIFAGLAFRETRKQAKAAQDQLRSFDEANIWQKKIALMENRPRISFGELVLVGRYKGHHLPIRIQVSGSGSLYSVEVECEIRSHSWATDPPTEATLRAYPKRTFPLIDAESYFLVDTQFNTREKDLKWHQGPGLSLDLEIKLKWRDELGHAIEKHFISHTMTTLPLEPIPLSPPIPSFYKDDLYDHDKYMRK